MRSRHIPMTLEEFEGMACPFGWKAEYWDGQAHLTPREYVVRTRLSLTTREVPASVFLRPADPSHEAQMIEGFFEAFRDSVEFCDWPRNKIQSHAERNIHGYFNGERGKPLPVSRMALDPGGDRLIGLALFVENKEKQAELDLLFVIPPHQRRGVATQMVAGAANRLHAEGAGELHSAYHVCNERSREWHHNYGFEDVPDPYHCRMKYGWYRHEIWRREKLGTGENLEALRRERDEWRARLPEEWRD